MQLMQKLRKLVVQKSDLNLTREFKADIRKQHNLYVNDLVGDVKANSRDFYRCIYVSQRSDTYGILH